MKNRAKIKRIIAWLITVPLTVLVIQVCGHVMDPAYSSAGFDTIEAFHKIEDNTLDVMIYGSSRAWKGCDTTVMADEYGLSAYNYGCNWQAINTTALFLQDSLLTQTPKVVCIETGLVDDIEKNKGMDGQIYYTKAMPNSQAKKDFLRQCFGKDPKKWLSYYVPLIVFHNNWNKITYESFHSTGYQYYLDSRGYAAGSSVKDVKIPDYHTFKQTELSEDSLQALDKIVAACKEKGVQIIFYTAPIAEEYDHIDALKAYAEKNGCVYLDIFEYADEIGIRGDTDFQDETHLNTSGAAKLARFLSEYIIAHYNVPHTVS